jgi:hypothetical protein
MQRRLRLGRWEGSDGERWEDDHNRPYAIHCCTIGFGYLLICMGSCIRTSDPLFFVTCHACLPFTPHSYSRYRYGDSEARIKPGSIRSRARRCLLGGRPVK